MDAVTNGAAFTAAETRSPKGLRLPSRRTSAASAAAIAVAVVGALWITSPVTSQSTDDAYVAADTTSVAPKVRGLIEEVLVRDNQVVHAGQPLVRIDPEEFDAKAASAEAVLADARAGVLSAQAALASLTAEERLARSNVVAADTSIRSAVARSDLAAADRKRYDALVAGGAVAKRDADSYGAAAVTAEQESARARALLSVSQNSAGVVSAKRPMLLAALETAKAKVGQAEAALDLARQDRRHTIIYAPVSGSIGNRQVRVGDYVQPGTRLLTLVPMNALYVTANFKETQTGHMQVGQEATIDVDALHGHDLKGTVESLAPGSGSSFSLLPFEPGTGNFTKVVQRVPVRIRFDSRQVGADLLRPGLSVTAKVRVRG
ncbi:HlyD family secretion protein [Sphingomonas glacialis]|uniref:HlyD family secretion protein n=1 Tax=Sphingomonas glacialis TaxID=658225 RepID=A0A502FSW7_9SPHN|nr:HlyD family secretion protein [Sphingomonas glacialis]TPG52093.1 HlyD family secretion protein [Sphingomonas glacialis]